MTPTEQRNELFAQHVITKLAKRHITAFYCSNGPDAVRKILHLLPEKSTISWGGSTTLYQAGIIDALYENGSYTLLDRAQARNQEEKIEIEHKAFLADFYLTSANAISEDGVIVNIDRMGNRVAAITYGPKQVIFVIGLNKVCQTIEGAISRARATAAPTNAFRFDLNTPCRVDGVCHNCHAADCLCSYIHILRHSPSHRHTVILVGESLGF